MKNEETVNMVISLKPGWLQYNPETEKYDIEVEPSYVDLLEVPKGKLKQVKDKIYTSITGDLVFTGVEEMNKYNVRKKVQVPKEKVPGLKIGSIYE